MWFVDFPTLVLLILAGLNVGMLAVSGYNAADGSYGRYSHITYALVGFSALWQLITRSFIDCATPHSDALVVQPAVVFGLVAERVIVTVATVKATKAMAGVGGVTGGQVTGGQVTRPGRLSGAGPRLARADPRGNHRRWGILGPL